jgi:hypothetical protein
MKKIKTVLGILALSAIASTASADGYTVHRQTTPAPSVTLVLTNTSGHLLEVQATENGRDWFTVLYNWEKRSGTWVTLPGTEWKAFRLVDCH